MLVDVTVQVPPVVTHTKLGTLYEEPCIVYFKVRCSVTHSVLHGVIQGACVPKKNHVRSSGMDKAPQQLDTTNVPLFSALHLLHMSH